MFLFRWLLTRGCYRDENTGGGSGGGEGSGAGDGGTGSGAGAGGANSNAGGGSAGNAAGNAGNTNQQQTFSLEYVQELREEAKQRRLRIDELDKQLADRDTRIAELEGRVTELTTGATVKDALAKAGAISPDILMKAGLIETAKLKLKDGQPDAEALAAAIDAVKAAHPEMFKAAGGNGNADAGAGGGTPTKTDYAKMPRDEFAKVMARVEAGERITP